MGGEDADPSSQAGRDGTQDTGRDPGEHGTGLEGSGALRHLPANRLEVAGSEQCP